MNVKYKDMHIYNIIVSKFKKNKSTQYNKNKIKSLGVDMVNKKVIL